MMHLRRHQRDFVRCLDNIINSGDGGPRNIVADVTSGGGKNVLAMATARLVDAGVVDRVCVVVPRLSLADQVICPSQDLI